MIISIPCKFGEKHCVMEECLCSVVWTGSDGLPAWSIRISLRQEISGMRQISTQEMELACPNTSKWIMSCFLPLF